MLFYYFIIINGTRELSVDAIFVDDPTMNSKSFLQDRQDSLEVQYSRFFSHGRCRLIGTFRRIIDSI